MPFYRRIVVFCLAVSVVLGACDHFNEITNPDDLKIRNEDLVGRWTFNEHTFHQIERLRFWRPDKVKLEDNTIDLRKDGTCAYKSYTSFSSSGEYLISEGTWKLERDFDHGLGVETREVILELTPKPNNVVGVSFFLKKRNNIPILYSFINDPDLNQFVEFERKPD